MLSDSPIEVEYALGQRLAGLLTYASSKLSSLPRKLSSGVVAQFSANTVAGQWRTLTAFPNTRLCDLYREAGETSNTKPECGAERHLSQLKSHPASELQAAPTVFERFLRSGVLQ